MTIIKIDAPRLPHQLSEILFVGDSIQSEDRISFGVIKDCNISDIDATHVSFDQTIFRNVAMNDCFLHRAEFTDVVFENCDLSNIDFSSAIIHRTVFKNCKMIGIHLSESTLQNVQFSDCNCSFANLRFTKMKQVHFYENKMNHIDMYNSNVDKIYFTNCDLDQAQLSGTNLKGIDLSKSFFTSIGVNLEDIKGCIISPEQASIFAKQMGLIIKE